ncbi:hypothetical protein [Mycolicibacter arupensis]|jgi:hypothetical protein|uniref:Uncharacterized protein n=1 Tax=Mycolicibacter arupensis TaxID=342002 RepID=A0A0F5MXF5_9MYCO|nr:hypothetical protein [Mycolicibacter arupensis]KKB99450.1 hypothetical protein WR43_09510 [Mycolicibacter arupensis]MCV7277054.1 hypothetical protein [Mycolicibacter arupensis]OQZ91333.1 hypothetical protein BST15_20050 [Mycolicibacter arupensis]TXI50242.1 MAG: hypothetical protein E6Q54_21575 [Mycolicibacter arupensis]
MSAHPIAVHASANPLFGRTFQPRCDYAMAGCGYRGPHVPTRVRAEAIADEHTNRTAGLDVTVW